MAPTGGLRQGRTIRLAEVALIFDADTLHDLAAIDPLAVPQPRNLHVVMGRPVSEVLDTTALKPIPNAGQSHGAHLLVDPALDMADASERWRQVTLWMEQAALDAGLLGMEAVLKGITPPYQAPDSRP